MAQVNTSLTTDRTPTCTWPRCWGLWLIPLLCVASFLRLHDIGGPSLWRDEIWSIEISTGRGSTHDHLPVGVIQQSQIDLTGLRDAPPWWKIGSTLAGVAHPPLYHVLLRWWMDLFGNTSVAVRVLSAVCSLAAIAVLFDVCRLLHGPKVGLLAAGMMALAPTQIDFAQEARSYALLILLGLGCCDALVRIERYGASWPRLTAVALLLLGMAMTHYFAAGAMLALAIYVLLRLRGSARRKALAAFAVAAVLFAALWGHPLYVQFHTMPVSAPPYLREPMPHHAQYTLLRLLALPGQCLFGEMAADAVYRAKTAVDWLFRLILLAITMLVLVFPLALLARRRDLLLWVLWVFATIGPVFLLDLIQHRTFLNYIRYTILASPAVYALIAALDWPPRRALAAAPVWAILVCLAILAAIRTSLHVAPREDWRQLAASLNANASADDLLVFYGDDPWQSPGTWYMGFKYYAPDSNRPWLILDRPAEAPLLSRLQARRTLWLIGIYPATEGSALLPGWQAAGPELRTSAGSVCRMVRPGVRP